MIPYTDPPEGFDSKIDSSFNGQTITKWTIKDKMVVYFIRWISCGWKQDYFIQKYRQRKLLHNYDKGTILLQSFEPSIF